MTEDRGQDNKAMYASSSAVPSLMDMNLELTVTIGFSVVGGKSNNIGMMSKSALPLPLSETRIKRCLYECKEALEKVGRARPCPEPEPEPEPGDHHHDWMVGGRRKEQHRSDEQVDAASLAKR
jgi:hypothetical protein